MNILVIVTGGTIGSTVKDGWISADKNTKYTLLSLYNEKFGNDVSFTVYEPYFLLSENLSSRELNLLLDEVRRAVTEDFDGIIITHGTDSLLFSAAAVGNAAGSYGKPIIFVSANYPLSDPRSNGYNNFESAVRFISEGCAAGVFISYQNPDGKRCFHRALRVVSYLEADDSIYSLNKKPFAVLDDDKIKLLDTDSVPSSSLGFTLCEKPDILCVSACPEDSFIYDVGRYNAVILRPYHSGTFATSSEAFRSFCKKAEELKIPVFLVNSPLGTTYETSKEYEKLGIIPLKDTTFTATYIRIWIGISRGENLKNLF